MNKDCIELPIRQIKKHINLAKSYLGTKSPKPMVVTVIMVIHRVSETDTYSDPSICL